MLVTHLHADHLDETAVDLLPKDVPLVCQPPDEGVLRDRGFADVRPVADELELDGIAIARTDGRHGTGEIAELLAPVSGFVLSAPGEPTLYVAGDTVWCDEVAAALDAHRPDVVVVNAGGARFTERRPDHDDRRRHRRGRRAAPRARGSSPCTWRRSTTASRPAPTCTSACASRAWRSASPSPRTARSCPSRSETALRQAPVACGALRVAWATAWACTGAGVGVSGGF